MIYTPFYTKCVAPVRLPAELNREMIDGILLDNRMNVAHASRLVDSGLTGNSCEPILVGLILRSP